MRTYSILWILCLNNERVFLFFFEVDGSHSEDTSCIGVDVESTVFVTADDTVQQFLVIRIARLQPKNAVAYKTHTNIEQTVTTITGYCNGTPSGNEATYEGLIKKGASLRPSSTTRMRITTSSNLKRRYKITGYLLGLRNWLTSHRRPVHEL